MLRLRCAERTGGGFDRSYPVKVIVFDFDETLSLATFMPAGGVPADVAKLNFESPWVPGSRVRKLQQLFQALREGRNGRRRALAVLTKNSNPKGLKGVVGLLEDAGLAGLLDAVWILPARPGQPSGAFHEAGEWRYFEAPVGIVAPYKADVLQDIAANPGSWFPQARAGAGGGGPAAAGGARLEALLGDLRPEGIVLVDDQRANFQSATGAQVLRYCKVARYDAVYRNLGLVTDMGGIGAHDDADFETLRNFVEEPWAFKESLRIRCCEAQFDGQEERRPVKLVVFDFDETLTLATFMPKDPACAKVVGWTPEAAADKEWTTADLVAYNFESPFVEGGRLDALRQSLERLAAPAPDGSRRALAVLTRNESGVVAVLNLLSLARLDRHFSAIWAMPAREGSRSAAASGAYQSAGSWTCFEPPADAAHDHKADLLLRLVANPEMWFPQLGREEAHGLSGLVPLHPESVVLVDDERASFRSDSAGRARVPRFCKVARYDEVYRDCGPLNQMGGLGAHCPSDFEALAAFVERPWDFPCGPRPASTDTISDPSPALLHPQTAATLEPRAGVTRASESEELLKVPRARRSATSLT